MAQAALIKITIDPSKGIATINGVKVALNDLANAQKRVNEEIEENNKAIEGSLKWHKMMVSKLNAERDALSTNSDEFDELTVNIKKHNLAIAEITQNKEREIGVVKGSFQYYENEIKLLRRQQKAFADSNAAVLEYEARIQKLRAEQRNLAQSTKLTGKGMQTMSTASGLAGAAATEFGRAVGDAQYGIQGISNNVQQLSALFTDLVQQQGSVGKAFKLFTTTLMGPAGVLVAVSLITTAMEAYSRKQREAAKDSNALADAEGGAAVQLKILRDALADSNTSAEKRNQLVTDANKEYEDLNLQLDENNELTKESKIALDDAILSMERAAKARALQASIEEEYKKQAKGFIDEGAMSFRALATVFFENAMNLSGFLNTQKAASVAVDEANKAQEESQERINKLLEQYLELKDPDKEKEDEKERKKIAEDRLKFEQEMIKRLQDQEDDAIRDEEARDLAKLERAYQRELEEARKLGADTTNVTKFYEEEKQRVVEQYAAERVEAERNANLAIFLDRAKNSQKLADLEAKLADKRLKDLLKTEKEQLDADIRFLESRIKVLAILRKVDEESERKYQEALILLDDLRIRRNNLVDKSSDDAEKKLAAAIDAFKAVSTAVNDVLEAEAEREIAIETNKTNALNEQLRERLRNEELSKNERDRINQEIARNDAALVEKENAINRKRFEQQKTFNIAMAVIDTFVGANKALKDDTIPNTFVRIAAMVSVISAGLANVASIARQQFVAKTARIPALRGDGAETSGPAFNVVGASGQNQLAQAIEGISAKPIKTYVVSSDVSSAQELDRKIVEGASI